MLHLSNMPHRKTDNKSILHQSPPSHQPCSARKIYPKKVAATVKLYSIIEELTLSISALNSEYIQIPTVHRKQLSSRITLLMSYTQSLKENIVPSVTNCTASSYYLSRLVNSTNFPTTASACMVSPEKKIRNPLNSLDPSIATINKEEMQPLRLP